jgi:hypothetical protein
MLGRISDVVKSSHLPTNYVSQPDAVYPKDPKADIPDTCLEANVNHPIVQEPSRSYRRRQWILVLLTFLLIVGIIAIIISVAVKREPHNNDTDDDDDGFGHRFASEITDGIFD